MLAQECVTNTPWRANPGKEGQSSRRVGLLNVHNYQLWSRRGLQPSPVSLERAGDAGTVWWVQRLKDGPQALALTVAGHLAPCTLAPGKEAQVPTPLTCGARAVHSLFVLQYQELNPEAHTYSTTELHSQPPALFFDTNIAQGLCHRICF